TWRRGSQGGDRPGGGGIRAAPSGTRSVPRGSGCHRAFRARQADPPAAQRRHGGDRRVPGYPGGQGGGHKTERPAGGGGCLRAADGGTKGEEMPRGGGVWPRPAWGGAPAPPRLPVLISFAL